MKEHCNIALIPLTQGQYAIVDIWNYEWLNQWKWYAQKERIKYRETFYAVRNISTNRTKIRMHRIITSCPKNMKIDHINGETLKNTENNLRIVTPRENSQNRHHIKTSKYTGVSWDKRTKKWISRIQINGKQIHLGYYCDEEEAYKTYKKECEKNE